jgi:hypothetical protein
MELTSVIEAAKGKVKTIHREQLNDCGRTASGNSVYSRQSYAGEKAFSLIANVRHVPYSQRTDYVGDAAWV